MCSCSPFAFGLARRVAESRSGWFPMSYGAIVAQANAHINALTGNTIHVDCGENIVG